MSSDRRREDSGHSRTWFRSDRLIHQAGQWYFNTREKTIVGPFESELEALQRVETYAKVMSLALLETSNTAELQAMDKRRASRILGAWPEAS